MTDSSRGTGLPRDSRTRDRLREAQQLEARALADVCRAQETLSRICTKRDVAQAALETAQAALVRASGLERAALLLAADAAALRRVANAHSRQASE